MSVHDRRAFLAAAACATAALLTRSGIADAQAEPFRGVRAGEQRTVGGVRLCWCPPGRFVMGSPPDERGRRGDEAQVEVTLTKGFWTARHEVTQGQWRAVVEEYPDRPPTPRFGEGSDFPVYWVSFHEAEDFCARLSERARRAGELPRGWALTLPTEAQWEYACRAGTVTATSFGDDLSLRQANFDGMLPGGGRSGPAPGRATRVGSYPPNPWGIRDMHGNVWEWCQDWYHARLPGGTDPDLRSVPGVRNGDGTYSRVRRGGAWIESAAFCRSACRLRYEPLRRSDHIGFRVIAAEL